MDEVERAEQNPIFLAGNLRLLRKQKSWSQEELAARIGLNRGNIASYEKGTAEPKICNLLKISQIFGVSIIDLTRRDLREQAQRSGKTAFVVDNSMMRDAFEKLDELSKEAEELSVVIKSIHTCHCHKRSELDEMPRDVQMLVGNFEHLYDVTRQLLQQHKELLEAMQGTSK